MWDKIFLTYEGLIHLSNVSFSNDLALWIRGQGPGYNFK